MRTTKFRVWDEEGFDYFDLDCPPDATKHTVHTYPGEILEQFTGLCDRNGKEIYEGDVVRACDAKLQHTFSGVVTFRDASFCIKSAEGTTYYYRWTDYELEKLGNIHENHELMGGGE